MARKRSPFLEGIALAKQKRQEHKRQLANILAGKGGTITLYPPKPRKPR